MVKQNIIGLLEVDVVRGDAVLPECVVRGYPPGEDEDVGEVDS
jgi:hypothetical protein